jgi:hypothetical protein
MFSAEITNSCKKALLNPKGICEVSREKKSTCLPADNFYRFNFAKRKASLNFRQRKTNSLVPGLLSKVITEMADIIWFCSFENQSYFMAKFAQRRQDEKQ